MSELSVFDVLGPKMIGPSSSHTAGACRIGKVANKMTKGKIVSAKFFLHGSFSKTYRGHGTDRALVGGLLGFDPDDQRIVYSFDLAREQGVSYEFIETDLGDVHTNSVMIRVENHEGESVYVTGASIGGGNVVITEINGLKIRFTGEYFTLVVPHFDRPGIIAKVTARLASNTVNIAFMRVYRHEKGQEAFMIIESDEIIDQDSIDEIKWIDGVTDAYSINIRH